MIITNNQLRDELNRLANAVGRKPLDAKTTQAEWMAELRKIGATIDELRAAIDWMRGLDQEWYGFPPIGSASGWIKARRTPDGYDEPDDGPIATPAQIRAAWSQYVDLDELEAYANRPDRR